MEHIGRLGLAIYTIYDERTSRMILRATVPAATAAGENEKHLLIAPFRAGKNKDNETRASKGQKLT